MKALATAHLPTVLVLASGKGERFAASGGKVPKLQALLAGKKIIDWTLDAVRVSGLPWHLEDAGHPGMGDSIAAAVRATRGAAGWLILPADLPLIKPQTLVEVAQALRHAKLVVPQLARQQGHPVGFSKDFLNQLLSLQGNKGASHIINAQAAMKLVVTDVGSITDIDTLDDLQHAQNLLTALQIRRNT